MSKRVLIAEDEEAIARLIQLSIERGGHTAIIAVDGRDALRLLKEESFDVIVLDLLMPYIDGTEVLHWIRSNSATKEVPVVILATCPPSEAEALIAKHGWAPTQFLRKPFDQAELLRVVSTIE